MEEQKLHYGELPTLVRLIYILVAFVIVSAFIQAISMQLIADSSASGTAVSFAAPVFILITSFKLIRRKNRKSYYSALAILACSPVITAYAVFNLEHLTSSYPIALIWWPITNALILFACIASLFSPRIREFYYESTT